MKIKTLLLALPVLATLLPLSAQAQTVNQRQRNQQNRIYQGVRNGSLTPSEARALEARTRRITEAEARARRSGGHLSAAEHAHLQRALDRNSQVIESQERDSQRYNRTGSINRRQYEQQQRIRQGIRNGSLTNVEARGLQAREARLRYLEARDRQTGHHLSSSERRELQSLLNSSSRSIYNQKHDRNYRWR